MAGRDEVTWSAPGRANLIGEHTDYNDGYAMPFALDRRTVVHAVRRQTGSGTPMWTVSSDFADEPVSFDLATPVAGWAAYVAGVVWVLREAGYHVPAADLRVSSDVPVGAGLSSSAALESAVLGALADLGGLDIPRERMPALAQRAENAYVGVPCGILDQSASILSQAGHGLLLDCRTLATRLVPLDGSFLVIDVRAPHSHVDNEYAERRATCHHAAKLLDVPALRDVDDLDAALAALPDEVTRRRVRHVVTEDRRVLDTVAALERDDLPEVGRLMSASHASLCDDYQVSVPRLDVAVEAAVGAGALGARMIGGGFGGCVLALLPEPGAATAVAEAVSARFDARGWREPAFLSAVPSAGAGPLA